MDLMTSAMKQASGIDTSVLAQIGTMVVPTEEHLGPSVHDSNDYLVAVDENTKQLDEDNNVSEVQRLEGWDDSIFNQPPNHIFPDPSASNPIILPAPTYNDNTELSGLSIHSSTLEPQLVYQLPNLTSSWGAPSSYIIGGQSSDTIRGDGVPDYLIEVRPYPTMTNMIAPETSQGRGLGQMINSPNAGTAFMQAIQQSTAGSPFIYDITSTPIAGSNQGAINAGPVSGLDLQSSPILSIPIDLGGGQNLMGGNEVISGQQAGAASLLSLIIPAITNPQTINGLVQAGQAGMQGIAAIREGKQLRDSLDPEKSFQQYQPAGQLAAEVEKGGKFRRFLSCQENGEGICCVMPDFCHPWAECSSDVDELGSSGTIGLVTDIIAAVPRCQCRPGFIGDGRRDGNGCTNANECDRGESGCQHKCTDLSPGYACSCHEGFRLTLDQMTCEDIDECAEGSSQCEHRCVNQQGGYACECDVGYLLNPDGLTCQEIDECALMKELELVKDPNSVPAELYELYPSCEVIELCVNSVGGYLCDCPVGFALAEDGLSCLDVDECADGTSRCPANASCLNQFGYYECLCEGGYQPTSTMADILGNNTPPDDPNMIDFFTEAHQALKTILNSDYGPLCIDVDECASPATCDFRGGLFKATCSNINGGFECQCSPNTSTEKKPNRVLIFNMEDGFLSPAQESAPSKENGWDLPELYIYDPIIGGCIAQDPCFDGPCGANAECSSESSTGRCSCLPGFEMASGLNGFLSCVDIDECMIETSLSDQQSLTSSLATTFDGVPSSLFFHLSSSPTDSLPIQSRSLDSYYPGGCGLGCLNLEGSYQCQCPPGFAPDGQRGCEDIDECASGVCDSACLNYPGGYQCLCPPGYRSRSTSDLGSNSVAAALVAEELNWMTGQFPFPRTIDELLSTPTHTEKDVVSLWINAIQAQMCRPREDLCTADILGDETNVNQMLCTPTQQCSGPSPVAAANYTSISDFMSPIQCHCPSGYRGTEELKSEYPMDVRNAFGIPVEWRSPDGDYSSECLDIDECQEAADTQYWGLEPEYSCKKGRPCCVNEEGSYSCVAKKKGECPSGATNIYFG